VDWGGNRAPDLIAAKAVRDKAFSGNFICREMGLTPLLAVLCLEGGPLRGFPDPIPDDRIGIEIRRTA